MRPITWMSLGLIGLGLLGPGLLAGCSAADPSSDGGTTTGPTVSVSLPPPSPVAAAVATLPCDEFIGTSRPSADLTVVDGVVALPTSPRTPALQVSRSGYDDPQVRFFAKTGLQIRTGKAFTLSVPPRLSRVAAIGWSNSAAPPTHRLVVPRCQGAGATWLAYPGGYWAAHPMCLPLRVTVQGRVHSVSIGIGKACPGQSPPPLPSTP